MKNLVINKNWESEEINDLHVALTVLLRHSDQTLKSQAKKSTFEKFVKECYCYFHSDAMLQQKIQNNTIKKHNRSLFDKINQQI